MFFYLLPETLHQIAAEKEKIRHKYNVDRVDRALYQWWFVTQSHHKFPIGAQLLKAKALKLAGELNIEDFAASQEWFNDWKAKFRMISLKLNL